MKYCPDCGAERQTQDDQCQECHFPLCLEIHENDQGYQTGRGQKESWQKVWTLLRKSGLTIQTNRDKGMSQNQAWLIFPIIGFIILLLSVLFSKPLAQWLIPVKANVVAIDLGQANRTTHGKQVESDSQLSILREALEATEDQNNYEELVPPEVMRFMSEEDILRQAEDSVVTISIEGRSGYGTLFLPGGYILTTSHLLENAFKRVKGIIEGEGTYKQGTKVIEPGVYFKNQSLKGLDLIQRIETPPIAIMESSHDREVTFKLNFQDPLYEDSMVWVAYEQAGNLFVEKVKIAGILTHETFQGFELPADHGNHVEGMPVFNEEGHMVGIQIEIDGKNGLMTLIQLREKAPIVYRDIHNLLEGSVTHL